LLPCQEVRRIDNFRGTVYKSTVTFQQVRERARNRAKGNKYASGC